MTKPEGQKISKVEFIALMALMFATVAFSIDAMLPSLPQIAQEIAHEGVAQAALVITFFVIG
ncbi:MAG: multidrug MFS transporter, partial [Tateyamaria sp.]